MAEKEYIEREAFIIELFKQAITDDAYGMGIARGLEIAENIAKRMPYREIPTADVVEVVRCKDCKHSRERSISEKVYLIEGVLICTSADATDECWNPVWPDHFCSYGERSGE